MRLLRVLGTACLACCLEPLSLCARQPEVAAYPTLVAAYRQGRLGAVDVVLAMPERVVTNAVDQAIDPPTGLQAWLWQDLRAAALLHTDAWYTDLSNKRAGRANVQLEFAQKLLAHVVRLEPTQADYAQRWYDVVVQFLRKLGTAMQLEDVLTRGRLRFPVAPAREKAIPFVTRGLNAEYSGSTKGQVMAPGSREAPGSAFQMRWWADAATQFSQALALDRSYHLAALHLGRVRMLQGNRTEAAKQFSDAVRAHDARVAYLASLFLGSLSERDDRYDEAERLYRDALERYPSGQAAPLALSQLLSRTSREVEARAVLVASLTGRRGRVVEPLWTYIPSPVVEIDDMLATLAELRAEVMK